MILLTSIWLFNTNIYQQEYIDFVKFEIKVWQKFEASVVRNLKKTIFLPIKLHCAKFIPKTMNNNGLMSSGVSLTSWWEGVSLALAGSHPSNDGIIIIKIFKLVKTESE